jgi:protein TonB
MSLRERRGIRGSLGLSLALHTVVVVALLLAQGARPVDPSPEPVSSGLVRVELVAAPGLERAPALAAEAPPPVQRAPEPAPARLRPTGPRVAVVHARPSPLRASAPEPAEVPVELGSGASQALAPEAAGAGEGAATERADGGAIASGVLSHVARPASEIVPRYPELARERGDEAEVIVEAWVAASGRVERARVRSSAGAEFDVAALAAVREARFHPAWRDGAPVDSVVAMRLHFELER